MNIGRSTKTCVVGQVFFWKKTRLQDILQIWNGFFKCIIKETLVLTRFRYNNNVNLKSLSIGLYLSYFLWHIIVDFKSMNTQKLAPGYFEQSSSHKIIYLVIMWQNAVILRFIRLWISLAFCGVKTGLEHSFFTVTYS